MFKTKNAKYWIVGTLLLPIVILFFDDQARGRDFTGSLACLILISPFLLGTIVEWFYDLIKIGIVFIWVSFLSIFGLILATLGWRGIFGFGIYFLVLTYLFLLYLKNIKPKTK